LSAREKMVAVAMSGGVDSSVAALMMMQAGYEVMGVTMLHFDGPARLTSPHQGDPSPSAAEDAAAVCRHLGIPHRVVDLRDRFRSTVIDGFVSEYLAGRTPNPCVLCNLTIKWGALCDYALAAGAGLFATGHYARRLPAPPGGRHLLRKAANLAKDQSYALWRLTQEQLARTLFPLGELTKNEVRALAAENQLPVAQKTESQEICFIHDDNYQRFIAGELERKGITIPEGEIATREGKIVGRHRGFPYYTIGQRKGLGVALGHPVFVTAIDPAANRITIGEKEQLLAGGLTAESANWIAEAEPPKDEPVEARIRYKDPGYPGRIEKAAPGTFTLRFLEPRPAVTPGQSVVLYRGEIVLGGGIITRAIP